MSTYNGDSIYAKVLLTAQFSDTKCFEEGLLLNLNISEVTESKVSGAVLHLWVKVFLFMCWT